MVVRKLIYVASVLLCLFVLVGPARIASAHVFLKSAQPPPDQVVPQSPSEVVLIFSGDLTPNGNQITVKDAAGTHFETGTASVSVDNATTLKIALKPLLTGVFIVTYRVVSAVDGHETTGDYRFGVGSITLTPDLPNRACAMLPPLTPSPGNNISVRITSPSDNTSLTTSTLDYVLATTNFDLGSNGNYADVWLDGQRVDRIISSGGHTLSVPAGIHDVCISLTDGQSKLEVGARAGIRVVVRQATAQSPSDMSLSSISAWLAVVSSLAVLLVAIVFWKRTHPNATK